jgi:hypothetical protein
VLGCGIEHVFRWLEPRPLCLQVCVRVEPLLGRRVAGRCSVDVDQSSHGLVRGRARSTHTQTLLNTTQHTLCKKTQHFVGARVLD